MKHISHDVRLLRDWKIILGVFAVLVCIVMMFHGYFLYRLNQGDVFVVSGESRDESIVQQKKAIRRVNQVFEEKEMHRASALEAGGEFVPVVDPSL